jgi:hypothetical protein
MLREWCWRSVNGSFPRGLANSETRKAVASNLRVVVPFYRATMTCMIRDTGRTRMVTGVHGMEEWHHVSLFGIPNLERER